MSYLYKRNSFKTKYKYKKDHIQEIDVLFPAKKKDSDNTQYECDAYLDAHPAVETTSYKRRFASVIPSHLAAHLSFYSKQIIYEEPCEELCEDDEIGCFFQDYLHKSKPLKIIRFYKMREKEGTCDWSTCCVDKKGALLTSFPELVESLPPRALDLLVTVQAKPRRPINPSECRLCATAIVGDMWGTQIRQVDGVEPTEAELHRHNMHLVDSMLQVAPVVPDDEQNLFYGQEDQISTEMKLGDVLGGTDLPFRVYVAQESIFSNRDEEEARVAKGEESCDGSDDDVPTTKVKEHFKTHSSSSSNSSSEESCDGSDDDVSTTNNEVYVTRDGRVELEEGSRNTATLAMLLPWIRVPAFLLRQGGSRIRIREINLWLSREECRTNTHYDGHHNLLMVLSGAKTVELSPPATFRGSPVIGDHANHPYLLRCKQVGGHLVNRYFARDVGTEMGPPNATSTQGSRNNIVVSITAGEALFIPEGWWHRVESTAQCMAINVWFDHSGTSLSSLCHKNNQHMLNYQAREMVRQYLDANIEESCCDLAKDEIVGLLRRLGFDSSNVFQDPWTIPPHSLTRKFLEGMSCGDYFDLIRNRSVGTHAIEAGLSVLGNYASQVFNTVYPDSLNATAGPAQPSLHQLALSEALPRLGQMISYFILIMMYPQNDERDRRAIFKLFSDLPTADTLEKRQMHSILLVCLTEGACYLLSLAWEKHRPVEEARKSFEDVFGRTDDDVCNGQTRKHFMAKVDSFRNKSAQRLILGDLMLLNPEKDNDESD